MIIGKGRLILIVGLFGWFLMSGQLYDAGAWQGSPHTGPTPEQQAAMQGKDFTKFLHDSAAHKAKDCNECHVRQGSDPIPKFPPHNACVECHVAQFTSQSLGICANCHQKAISKEGPLVQFPTRQSFDITFDAKQHENHIAYPIPNGPARTDCRFCHQVTSQGQAETYPDHPQCYVCHTPGANSKAEKKSGCITCHPVATKQPVQPLAVGENGPTYKYKFAHQTHNPREQADQNDCASCHALSGRTSQQQPSKIYLRQGHTSACFNCHNDQKQYNGRAVFGGNNAGQCFRCHGTNQFAK